MRISVILQHDKAILCYIMQDWISGASVFVIDKVAHIVFCIVC